MAQVIIDMADNQPGTYNFPSHYRGDGLESFKVTIMEESVPVDLTGSTIRMQLKVKPTSDPSEPVVFEFSSLPGADGDITLSNPTGGEMTFATINEWPIPKGIYQYDLQVTDSTGFVRTYLRGQWAVSQDITT